MNFDVMKYPWWSSEDGSGRIFTELSLISAQSILSESGPRFRTIQVSALNGRQPCRYFSQPVDGPYSSIRLFRLSDNRSTP